MREALLLFGFYLDIVEIDLALAVAQVEDI